MSELTVIYVDGTGAPAASILAKRAAQIAAVRAEAAAERAENALGGSAPFDWTTEPSISPLTEGDSVADASNDGEVSHPTGATTITLRVWSVGGGAWTTAPGSAVAGASYRFRPYVATLAGIEGSAISDPVTAAALTVSIAGTPEVGETLTATPSAAGGTYQWQRDEEGIAGATASTYTLQAADDEAQVRAAYVRAGVTAYSDPVDVTYPAPEITGTLANVSIEQDGGNVNRDAGALLTGAGGSWAVTVDGTSQPTIATVSSSGVVTILDDTEINSAAIEVTYTNSGGSASVSFLASVTEASDTVPAAFDFTDETDADTSTAYTSAWVEITDTDADAPISITGGEYQIADDGSGTNAGGWSSASGTFAPGKFVQVRGTSSASDGAAVNVTLTIGGVSGTFTITTAAAAGPQAVAVTEGTVEYDDDQNLEFSFPDGSTATLTAAEAATLETAAIALRDPLTEWDAGDDGTAVGHTILITRAIWTYAGTEAFTREMEVRRNGTLIASGVTAYTLVSADGDRSLTFEDVAYYDGSEVARAVSDAVAIPAFGSGTWSITDNGDGTFDMASAPAVPVAPTITDNGDGTLDVAA